MHFILVPRIIFATGFPFIPQILAQMNCSLYHSYWASLEAQQAKNPPAMQDTPVQFLDRKDPLEKG